MDTYSFLRELADSWVLLAMTVFYVGAIVWAFRPGSRALHDEIANIPLRDDPKTCSGVCETCACKKALNLVAKEAVQ